MQTRRFVGSDGNGLVASLRGEGALDVLLLHGGGQTRHAWDGAARAIASAGWRAISLDQRGHGDSDWVESGRYGAMSYAADAIAVAQALRDEIGTPPVAVGASLGGLASLLAQGIADCFAAIVLVDVVPQMDSAGVGNVVGFMRAHATEGFTSVEEAADAIAAYLPHRPRPRSLAGLSKNLRLNPDGRWRWHWDPRFVDGPGRFDHDRAEAEPRLLAAARDLSVPSLLIRGASSELVTDEVAAAFARLSPQTRQVDIADARHMVAGDRNDAFAGAVLSFLSSLPLKAETVQQAAPSG